VNIFDKLRPHQVEPTKRLLDILSKYQSAVDFSDTGTGKTYVACAVASLLNVPTLVVAPKISRTTWERTAGFFDEQLSIVGYEKLRTGNTPFGWWQNPMPENPDALEFFKCQSCQLKVDMANWQPCYTHPLGIHCLESHRKSWDYGRFNFFSGIQFLIFDEAHRCSGMNSLNADMLIAAKRQGIKTLILTATPACNPLGMRALGYVLDLHNNEHDLIAPLNKVFKHRVLRNFYSWASQYGCRRDARFRGFKWMVGREKQLAVMDEIRDIVTPARGVRVTTASIPNFPKRTVSVEMYDLDEAGMIERLYAEMADSLSQLAERASADMEHPLTTLLRAQQKIELLKVPIAVELARDYLDKGHSIGIFVNYSQTLDALRERLKCDCYIDGRPEGVKIRQRCIDSFQANEDRLILVLSAAGKESLSLHDITGDAPRVGLVFPGFSAVTFRQLLGRFHREGGLSPCFYRILLAAGTVEEQIRKSLGAKLDNLDMLLDSDMLPENMHYSNVNLSITETGYFHFSRDNHPVKCGDVINGKKVVATCWRHEDGRTIAVYRLEGELDYTRAAMLK
jgi:Mimiviridae putative ATP-dependent RNA helicase